MFSVNTCKITYRLAMPLPIFLRRWRDLQSPRGSPAGPVQHPGTGQQGSAKPAEAPLGTPAAAHTDGEQARSHDGHALCIGITSARLHSASESLRHQRAAICWRSRDDGGAMAESAEACWQDLLWTGMYSYLLRPKYLRTIILDKHSLIKYLITCHENTSISFNWCYTIISDCNSSPHYIELI